MIRYILDLIADFRMWLIGSKPKSVLFSATDARASFKPDDGSKFLDANLDVVLYRIKRASKHCNLIKFDFTRDDSTPIGILAMDRTLKNLGYSVSWENLHDTVPRKRYVPGEPFDRSEAEIWMQATIWWN